MTCIVLSLTVKVTGAESFVLHVLSLNCAGKKLHAKLEF